jgi:NADPH:quinone reductase-like Zn-dependent oxidoreductase
MKAWQCDDARPVPGLVPVTVDLPRPGHDEVLIRVHAIGVTPTELLWYPTTHTTSGSRRHHAIPGHEFSGIVIAAGTAAHLAVGQPVLGMNDWYADGACAEYCCARVASVAAKPACLTHAEAATIPIGALTAWQGLFDRAGLKAGERVLIHGGSGAVGVLAIQLARWVGAEVITTASARHRAFLTQLGASQVIDYRTERFEDFVTNVDVVFDGVGGAILQRSWDMLSPHGRLVTIAASSEVPPDERTKQAFFIVAPHQEQLREITRLLDSRELRPVVDTEVPFARADNAFQPQGTSRRGLGKTVVCLIPENV